MSRDVFEDSTGKIAEAGFKLGFAHQKLGVKALNETPLGTVIAAPKPEDRELFCRNGLKWFAKIPAKKILAALKEIQKAAENFWRARNQIRIQEKFWRANWIWRRAWRRSRANSCCGSRPSPPEKSPRQNRWRKKASANCESWKKISTRIGRCETRRRRNIARRFCNGGLKN